MSVKHVSILVMVGLFFFGVVVMPLAGVKSGFSTLNAKAGTDQIEQSGVGSSIPASIEWSKTYGGTGRDWAFSLVQTSDGGYALAGETRSFGAGYGDCWLVKTNEEGVMQWEKKYGGADEDVAECVIQTGDGYALAGLTDGYYGDQNFYLVKTNAEGVMQWEKKYGGEDPEWAYSVVQTGDGGYAVAGTTFSFGAGELDFWLVKTNDEGVMQWNKTYGGTAHDIAKCVVQTSEGGYALAGETQSFGAGNLDFWLVKTDENGNVEWNKTYGETGGEWPRCMIQTSDGGYALLGETTSFGAEVIDVWLVKTDKDGNKEWDQTYGGTDIDAGTSVIQTSDGGYALTGHIHPPSGTDPGYLWLVKTDKDGEALWNMVYGGTGSDVGMSIVQASGGEYVIGGYTNSSGAGDFDFLLVKTAIHPYVGGFVINVDKLSLLSPFVGLALTITVTALATIIHVKTVRHSKNEK